MAELCLTFLVGFIVGTLFGTSMLLSDYKDHVRNGYVPYLADNGYLLWRKP
jgi:hypothetical protein